MLRVETRGMEVAGRGDGSEGVVGGKKIGGKGGRRGSGEGRD